MRAGWVAVLALAACDPPAPGMVQGDAFLVEDIGREANLAGMQVRLLPEDAELDSTLARICPTRDADPPDPAAAHLAALAQRERILRPRVRSASMTDARARFVFTELPPGDYRLWADTMLGPVRWSWLVPVTVPPGGTVHVELSNANPDENPFRCTPRQDEPTPLTTKK
jgi:hypothetical protein